MNESAQYDNVYGPLCTEGVDPLDVIDDDDLEDEDEAYDPSDDLYDSYVDSQLGL